MSKQLEAIRCSDPMRALHQNIVTRQNQMSPSYFVPSRGSSTPTGPLLGTMTLPNPEWRDCPTKSLGVSTSSRIKGALLNLFCTSQLRCFVPLYVIILKRCYKYKYFVKFAKVVKLQSHVFCSFQAHDIFPKDVKFNNLGIFVGPFLSRDQNSIGLFFKLY